MTSSNTTPQTLSQLFQRLGLNLRCYDIGRKIQALPTAVWQSFESCQRPYPQPYLRQAWLALVIDDGTEQMQANPMLWFIRLPLDEFSQLETGCREQFMGAILHRLGRQMEQAQLDGGSVDLIEDNPFVFTPSEEKLCQLQAILRADLNLPPSKALAAVIDFFDTTPEHDDEGWKSLELAGLADIAVRSQEHQQRLTKALPTLPTAALAALCQGLENQNLDTSLSKLLDSRIRQLLSKESKPALIAALLRGLSQSTDLLLVRQLIIDTLKHSAGQDIEVLATISNKHSLQLLDAEICLAFLEQLARYDDGNSFGPLVTELLTLPLLKSNLIRVLNQHDRSDPLKSAVNKLLDSLR